MQYHLYYVNHLMLISVLIVKQMVCILCYVVNLIKNYSLSVNLKTDFIVLYSSLFTYFFASYKALFFAK